MEPLSVVVFDLDDTLYWERDYVRSGFKAVADHLATRLPADETFGLLWDAFERGLRGDLFDRLLAAHPESLQGETVAALVEVYREHRPGIELAPDVRALLDALRPHVRLGLISDGPLISQSRKVEALGLADLFDHVVLTDAWGRAYWKPHERPYRTIEETFGAEGGSLIYVADNPGKDFVTPRARGWQTLRLRCREQERDTLEPPSAAHAAMAEVATRAEMARFLLDRAAARS